MTQRSAEEVGAQADLITMNDAQLAVLGRMSDHLGYPFRDIAMDCDLPVREVRAIVRRFHTLGLTGYGPLYSEDSTALGGKGYWLAKPGWELQRQAWKLAVRALITPPAEDEQP